MPYIAVLTSSVQFVRPKLPEASPVPFPVNDFTFGVANSIVCPPHSSSLTAHQARTSSRVCASRRRSKTGALTCPRFTRGTAATSNTTARHRLTSSAPTLEAPAQVASPGRGGRPEVNLTRCTATSASPFPQVPSTPPACGRPLTWAPVAMGPALSKSAVPTQRRLPPCPLTLSLPQTASRWRQPWRRSTVGARGPR